MLIYESFKTSGIKVTRFACDLPEVFVVKVYFSFSKFIFHNSAELTYNEVLGNCYFYLREH